MTISQDRSNWIVGDQCAYSPYCSLNISQGANKENLFNNQELFEFIIISSILIT